MKDGERLNRDSFFELFKKIDEENYEVLGEKFTTVEVAAAKDFYAQLEYLGFFDLPLSILIELLDSLAVKHSVSARLILALILDKNDLGVFLLMETDRRVINVCKKRLQNLKYGLDIDSKIIVS